MSKGSQARLSYVFAQLFLWLGSINLLSGISTKSVQARKRPSAWRRSNCFLLKREGPRQSRLPHFPTCCIFHAGSFAVVYKGLDVEAWVDFGARMAATIYLLCFRFGQCANLHRFSFNMLF